MNQWLNDSFIHSASPSAFSRIDVVKKRNNPQHETFHENEEPGHESTVFIVRIRKSHKGSDGQATHQPNELSFGIPHISLIQ